MMIRFTGVAIAIGITPMLPAADANNLLLGSLAIIVAKIAYAFAGVWGKIKLAEFSPTAKCSRYAYMFFSYFRFIKLFYLWATKSNDFKSPI